MSKKIIVLDPGHGQYGNKSPNNTKYIEGTQMWHLANKLKAALEKYGFEVIITRPNIADNPSLDARGKTAGNKGACMFLSLHSNAPGKSADGSYSPTVTGSVVYYSMTRDENKALADALGNKVSEIMGHYYRGGKTRQYPDRPGVDYYGVIRASAQSGCKCALLIEHGFHTNVADSNFLLEDANLQKLAEAEAKIIADYFGMSETATEDTAENTIYRVQIGAFSKKAYAESTLAKAKAAGFTDAFIATSKTEKTVETPVESTPALKSVDEIAKEVIQGKWGNGTDRKNRLTEAGYNYSAVQSRVNELLK